MPRLMNFEYVLKDKGHGKLKRNIETKKDSVTILENMKILYPEAEAQ